MPHPSFFEGWDSTAASRFGILLTVGTDAKSGLNRRYRLSLEFLKEWFVDFKSLQRLEPKLKFPEHFDKLLPIN